MLKSRLIAARINVLKLLDEASAWRVDVSKELVRVAVEKGLRML